MRLDRRRIAHREASPRLIGGDRLDDLPGPERVAAVPHQVLDPGGEDPLGVEDHLVAGPALEIRIAEMLHAMGVHPDPRLGDHREAMHEQIPPGLVAVEVAEHRVELARRDHLARRRQIDPERAGIAERDHPIHRRRQPLPRRQVGIPAQPEPPPRQRQRPARPQPHRLIDIADMPIEDRAQILDDLDLAPQHLRRRLHQRPRLPREQPHDLERRTHHALPLFFDPLPFAR
jgi:hypothetical protein